MSLGFENFTTEALGILVVFLIFITVLCVWAAASLVDASKTRLKEAAEREKQLICISNDIKEKLSKILEELPNLLTYDEVKSIIDTLNSSMQEGFKEEKNQMDLMLKIINNRDNRRYYPGSEGQQTKEEINKIKSDLETLLTEINQLNSR